MISVAPRLEVSTMRRGGKDEEMAIRADRGFYRLASMHGILPSVSLHEDEAGRVSYRYHVTDGRLARTYTGSTAFRAIKRWQEARAQAGLG